MKKTDSLQVITEIENYINGKQPIMAEQPIMTDQRRKEAIEHIMSCLEDGYLDLGTYDQDELAVVKEAMIALIKNSENERVL